MENFFTLEEMFPSLDHVTSINLPWRTPTTISRRMIQRNVAGYRQIWQCVEDALCIAINFRANTMSRMTARLSIQFTVDNGNYA